ncbi:complement C1s subcomponent [Hyperolius riggenbachi]|uniref:complement C1s subcomponent n=1 Tax=Hyperolius riggenbachi TaxID=752182 RepID=UPI0035A3457C
MGFRWILLSFLGCACAASPSMFGDITSPNYPQGYPNNARESWKIQVPEGYGIRLYFIHLDIEPSDDCEYDSLKVIIGNEEQESVCGQSFSTGQPIKERYYPTTELSLLFTSDFSNQERYTGFSAYYMAVDVDECEEQQKPCSHFCNNYIGGYFCSCPPEYDLQQDQRSCGVNCSGGLYTELRGQISSPGYPSAYPENSLCDYKVILEVGYQIILTFQPEDFDIEESDDGRCAYDRLTVKTKDKQFGPYCGKKPPSRIETGSNEVDIEFETDSSGNNKGWKIRYLEAAKSCPTNVVENAILHPKQEKYVFKDMVTVQCEEGYEILEEQTKLPSFQAKCQADGSWSNNGLKCLPVDCGDPQKIQFGAVNFESTIYKAEARYSCKTDYYTLSGDETYRCSLNGSWLNSKGHIEPPKCEPVCGKTTLLSTSRIMGGADALDGYFPWMVFFPVDTLGLGGGSLISDQWVLTAAHVVQDNPEPRMRVGNVKLQHAKDLEGKRVILHPDWVVMDNDQRKNFDNDIALVQLKYKVEMGPCICPVCLPGEGEGFSPVVDKRGYIAGWGKKSDTQKKLRVPLLQYAPIFVRETAECKASEKTDQAFTENMFCAGGFGKDSCGGDSGGPLMFENQSDDTKTFYTGGIVSWGLGCGKFGMYTKVQNYLDWIKETIQKVELEEAGQESKPQNFC